MSTLLPKLTEAQVKALILGQSFGRGQSYYRDHAISDPVQRGNVLEARCEGSLPNPYRVRVTFGAENVLSTDCTCPVGSGCKHVAALLLTWVHHPDWFVERESVETMLDKRSKNELIILIKEMIKREPNLETLLDLPLPGTKTRRTRVDPEPYRRRVRNAFIGADEWEDNFAIASELSAVNDLADQFLEAEEWGNAQIVYQAVVEEGLANYENAMHDEGDVMSEIDRAAEG
ncbi:MAG TPA: SWIM zinc finger family protein, partial [Anaerolineales bacterium]|nr:SWIM zinc finger family protein [Anaerolineales bacterium]